MNAWQIIGLLVCGAILDRFLTWLFNRNKATDGTRSVRPLDVAPTPRGSLPNSLGANLEYSRNGTTSVPAEDLAKTALNRSSVT